MGELSVNYFKVSWSEKQNCAETYNIWETLLKKESLNNIRLIYGLYI